MFQYTFYFHLTPKQYDFYSTFINQVSSFNFYYDFILANFVNALYNRCLFMSINQSCVDRSIQDHPQRNVEIRSKQFVIHELLKANLPELLYTYQSRIIGGVLSTSDGTLLWFYIIDFRNQQQTILQVYVMQPSIQQHNQLHKHLPSNQYH